MGHVAGSALDLAVAGGQRRRPHRVGLRHASPPTSPASPRKARPARTTVRTTTVTAQRHQQLLDARRLADKHRLHRRLPGRHHRPRAAPRRSLGLPFSVGTDGPSISGLADRPDPPPRGQVKFVSVARQGHHRGTASTPSTTRTPRSRSRTAAAIAQARSYTVVEIVGDNYSKSTLYGQPFSIG